MKFKTLALVCAVLLLSGWASATPILSDESSSRRGVCPSFEIADGYLCVTLTGSSIIDALTPAGVFAAELTTEPQVARFIVSPLFASIAGVEQTQFAGGIPEPATMAILGVCLIALGWTRSRFFKRR